MSHRRLLRDGVASLDSERTLRAFKPFRRILCQPGYSNLPC
jgi:hypothetical protein